MQTLDFPTLDIFTLPLEGDECMATTKERLDDHDARLAQVEVTLELKPPAPKASALKQKWERVINHKGTSVLLAIALCIVGIVGKYWIDHKNDWRNQEIDGRVKTVLEEKGGIKETLAEVRDTVNRTETKLNTLEPFIHDVIKHQFDSAAKLSPSALQERLPAIQHLTAVAQNQGVKIDVPVLNALGRNLGNVDPKAVGFWPTAAEFISYRSQTVTTDVQSLLRADLPNCTDHDPFPQTFAGLADEHHLVLTHAYYENCQFALDSAHDDERINWLILNQASAGIDFKHCLVTYQGGPVDLVLAIYNKPVTYTGDSSHAVFTGTLTTPSTLKFVNCLFRFALKEPPPQKGREFIQTLLAVTGPTIQFKVKTATHS